MYVRFCADVCVQLLLMNECVLLLLHFLLLIYRVLLLYLFSVDSFDRGVLLLLHFLRRLFCRWKEMKIS